jgi:acyl carrier protein
MNTLERVTKVVAEILRVPEVELNPSMRIEDIAETDSLTLAELATALDAEFNVRVPSDGLADARSVADLEALIRRCLEEDRSGAE